MPRHQATLNERRLMRLLNLKSVDQLNHVLSQPSDQKVGKTMQPPGQDQIEAREALREAQGPPKFRHKHHLEVQSPSSNPLKLSPPPS